MQANVGGTGVANHSWNAVQLNSNWYLCDATWSSGPARLGYGGDSEVTLVSYGPSSSAKYITTYFRRAFEVADASLFRGFKIRLVRDDGAVVYLNGLEVFRSNLPAGAVNSSTLAPVALGGGDEFIAVETNLPPTGLRNGTNVIAVEVHQQSGGSSDLGFDQRRLRTALARRWARDLLSFRGSQADGCRGWSRTLFRYSQGIIPNASAARCHFQSHTLRSQPRRPEIPDKYPERGHIDHAHHSGHELGGEAEEITRKPPVY